MSGAGKAMDVTVVTVTYGDRAHLLLQVLDAARAQGVERAVVVDNGAAVAMTPLLAARYGGWAQVVAMGGNHGSAAGFKAGMERALAAGAPLLLLLDDDNLLAAGALARLNDALRALWLTTPQAAAAVLGFRADRHRNLLAQRGRPRRQRSTFRGFHILDIAKKIGKRRPAAAGEVADLSVGWAPYGGLLFHRTVIETIGLPDERFFLYEDDTEFTGRLTRAGGKIRLIVGAGIEDIETSWNYLDRQGSLSIWLNGGSDMRAFYAFRNGVFCDFHRRDAARALLLVNMLVYLAALSGYALRRGKFHRLALLTTALMDGMAGRLGQRVPFNG